MTICTAYERGGKQEGRSDRGVWMKPALIFPPHAGNGACMSILSGHARVAGIAGWPVTYSRSPRLHGFWLQRHGIDGAYIPLPIRPGEFATAMRGLLAAGFAGANVTIPHKLAAFEICDTIDDTARRAGAVNTLVFQDGKIAGSNTDGYGFVANLHAHGVDPAAGPALLLGAGGSARAVAAALLDAGASVTVANRTRARAEALARDLPGLRIADWDARVPALADHALVVNTTPLGMVGHDAARPRPVACAGLAGGGRQCLRAAGNATAGGRPCQGPALCRGPRHAAAPGRARLPRLVRRRTPGGRGAAAVRGRGPARCDDRSWPDRRHRHGQVNRCRSVPSGAHSGIRRRCRGAPNAGARRQGGARDRGGVSRAQCGMARWTAWHCVRLCWASRMR